MFLTAMLEIRLSTPRTSHISVSTRLISTSLELIKRRRDYKNKTNGKPTITRVMETCRENNHMNVLLELIQSSGLNQNVTLLLNKYVILFNIISAHTLVG